MSRTPQVTPYTDEIAAVAHRCWCRRMQAAGWRPGERIDHQARTHDALRPYAELSEFDRDHIRLRVAWGEFEDELAEAIDEPLMERELSAADIKVGGRVRMAAVGTPGEHDDDIGVVVALDIASPESGRIDMIHVRWPRDGDRAYCPTEHAIVRV